nr:pilus assembly PilX N-terminal domain-containing protein [uncultured Deefgea sp.]
MKQFKSATSQLFNKEYFMKTHFNSPNQQKGVAALFVTIMILLIATLGSLYASRNSYIAQKNATSLYQYDAALQAAEAGIVDLVPIIKNDLKILSTGVGTTTLLDKAPAVAATSCNPDPSAGGSYTLKKTFLAKNITLINSTRAGNNEPGLAYRIGLNITGSTLTATSVGCTSNSVTGTGSNVCSNSGTSKALVRNRIELGGSVTPPASALATRGHIDSKVSLVIQYPNAIKAMCGVLYGDGGSSSPQCDPTNALYNPANDPDNKFCLNFTKPKCASNACGEGMYIPDAGTGTNFTKKDTTLFTMTADDFFKANMGNRSREEMKSIAKSSGSFVDASGGCTQIAAAIVAAKTSATPLLWIEGDLTCATTATFPRDTSVIVNGNITSALNINNAFIYVKNVFQLGSINVTDGSVVVEDVWDALPLGDIVNIPLEPNLTVPNTDPLWNTYNYRNSRNDALWGKPPDTYENMKTKMSANGALNITYKAIKPELPPSAENGASGKWIDY